MFTSPRMRWTARVRQGAVGATMLTLVLACDDPVQPPQPNRDAPQLAARVQEDRPDEIPFVRISEKAPSFAGYYYDAQGDFVAVIADDGDRAAVRTEMETQLSERRVRSPGRSRPAQISFRRAQFTFRQLAHWRDLVSDGRLSRHPLLVSVDMDEARNRVTLGVLPDTEGRRLDELRASLEALGIPRPAVHFVTTGPIKPSVGAVDAFPFAASRAASATMFDSFSTLQDNASPFMGGLRIVPPGCTATLALDFNGSRHLATNSHCTAAIYELDGRVFFQADGVSRLGRETQDPLFTLFNGSRSRYSDGALALIDAGALTRRGAIARPSARNSGHWGGGYGTLTINPTRSFFTVTAVEQGHIMYDEVQKVGQRTGWTWGAIIGTCADDLGTDGHWRRCSTNASYFAQSGDSGSPVFRWFGGDAVTLMGLNWGATDEGMYSSYSGYQSFVRELGGTINPLTDITVSAPTGIYEQSAVSGNYPLIRWNAAVVSNSPYATTYQVWRMRCTGYSYCTPQPWELATTTTSTSWTDYSSYVYTYWGTTPRSGYPYVAYYVKAINMDVVSGQSWTVFFESWPS